MEQGEFESFVRRIKLFPRDDYAKGYERGIRRHYHGDSLGTNAEHEQWMSLDGDRADMARGYRDGFYGHPPDLNR
jgi:hypothetical protein